ncbi:IclR family transcriptional regulator domain-containing protein [Palleronia abyssalis]|uniref:Pca regulon regulatory protein n=1 Tax=Palleronia abyssalis TaxID=1501240 RepID=A0A2R8BW27_9RHOB|nr:IclR family transcriptional regulator C-terminal domain-containing protein [Palleronia abyssalis]SPJ24333.1 Pca regulon regulatory protein [Palleronia abyssalis]
MTQTAERPAEFVEALAKGLAIIEAFDSVHPEMTLSEIARRVGLSPAAARRSLITLSHLGYVGQTAKRFHLTPKVMSLGSGVYFSAGIDEILQPAVRGIVETFGDASSVGVLSGDDVIYVAHYSQQRARRKAAVVGACYPAYATSMGRILLAGRTDEEIDAYLARYDPQRLTEKTCTNPKALRAEVMVARRNGYSTTVDQLDYGITALAVPIRDAQGRTVAALNTSGYTGMVSPDELVEKRLPELTATASAIGHDILKYPALQSVLAG